MNSHVMEGKWTKLRGELQKRWGKLTNDDLDQIEGQLTSLEGKLRERYGYSKSEASEQVDQFMHEAREQFEEVQVRLGRKLRNTSEELQQRMDDARDMVRDKASSVEEKLKEVDVKDTVKENPLMIAGVALLLTLFIGMWLRSMRS